MTDTNTDAAETEPDAQDNTTTAEAEPKVEPEPEIETEGVSDLTEMDPEEMSIEELENQEWTLGAGPTKDYINFRGTVFLIEDPDDDTVLNMMAQADTGETSASDRMYDLCRSAITAPELTPERWRDMRMSERIGLLTRVSTAIGLNDMMDFPEDGQPAQVES